MSSTRQTVNRILNIKKAISSAIEEMSANKDCLSQIIDLIYELDDYSSNITVDIIQKTNIHQFLRRLLTFSDHFADIKEACHNFLDNVLLSIRDELFEYDNEFKEEIVNDDNDKMYSIDTKQLNGEIQKEIDKMKIDNDSDNNCNDNEDDNSDEECLIRTDENYLELIKVNEKNMVYEAKRKMRAKRLAERRSLNKRNETETEANTESSTNSNINQKKKKKVKRKIKRSKCFKNQFDNNNEFNKLSLLKKNNGKKGIIGIKPKRQRTNTNRRRNKSIIESESSLIHENEYSTNHLKKKVIIEVKPNKDSEIPIISLLNNGNDDDYNEEVTLLHKKTKRKEENGLEAVLNITESEQHSKPFNLSNQCVISSDFCSLLNQNKESLINNYTSQNVKETKLLRSMKVSNLNTLYNDYQQPILKGGKRTKVITNNYKQL